jgi:two-component system osmolarity sensor histidine kinase EnvZ
MVIPQLWFLNTLLPRSLLGRSLLILVTPLVLLQVVSTWVFYDSHWDTVTKRLAQSVAGDIAWTVAQMRAVPDEAAYDAIFAAARNDTRLAMVFAPGATLPDGPVVRRNLVDRKLAAALTTLVGQPFLIDSRSRKNEVEIHLQLPGGVLRVEAPRLRLYSSTAYVFVLWMLGTSLILFAVATVFMRDQVRPIRRLAAAAEAFGKGHEVPDFALQGAAEVRQAATAFNLMRDRISRQITQRTEMLAGVSHDLRTPLTRMKLELALLGERPDIGDLKADVAEMETMVEGYLAFARGEGGEQAAPTDLAALLEEVVASAARQGARVALDAPKELVLPLRRDALRRCLVNLVTNAHRYADRIAIVATRGEENIEIAVDDDGPGIPPERREDVFKPFFRLEGSRNRDTGGIGLGLTIARDVARGHGGDLTLEESPLGGLRATLRLPL